MERLKFVQEKKLKEMKKMYEIIVFGIVLMILGIIGFFLSTYRVVDPSEAHLVVTPTDKFVVSSDDGVATNKRKTYFAIPSWIPIIGRAIRIMDVTINEVRVSQETYEINQARYNVTSSTKYRIKDVQTSAETFIDLNELENQITEVIKASVRTITVKHDVVDARSKKQEMSEAIRMEMEDDFKGWGLELVNFQLVDFQDTSDSSIISDISRRREVEIESTTRQQNAEKNKQARVKEAESEEKSREREIMKDKVIGEREQLKAQKISEMEKNAEEKRFEVVKVRTIKQAEITKERVLVEANQSKEQEEILMEQKQLEGAGDKLRMEERAKGDASPIREKGLAEAEAKEKLQEALNKFQPNAIQTLVAEQLVEKDRAIGIETAKALKEADLKVFAGGGKAGEEGFNLGKLITSASVSNVSSADSLLNRIGRPNDLGMTAIALDSLKESPPKDKPVKDMTDYYLEPSEYPDSQDLAERQEEEPEEPDDFVPLGDIEDTNEGVDVDRKTGKNKKRLG